MIIWLYRRWKKSKQSTSASEQAPDLPSQQRPTKELVKYRLALFAALVLPVFLETLDYTGKNLRISYVIQKP